MVGVLMRAMAYISKRSIYTIKIFTKRKGCYRDSAAMRVF